MRHRFINLAKGRKQRKWLLLLFACVLGSAGFVGPTDRGARQPDAEAPATRVREGAASFNSFAALPVRETIGRTRSDPFAPRTWAVPAPPMVQAPEAPAPPTVPPLPYRFAGTVNYGDMRAVVLAAGERIHLVKKGEVIDELYYVRAVARDTVTLVYMPLGIEQQLAYVAGADTPAPAPIAAPVQVPTEERSSLPAGSPIAAR